MPSERLTEFRELLDTLPAGALPTEAAIDEARGAVAAAWMTVRLARDGGSTAVALDAVEKLTWMALEALAGEEPD